MLNQANLAIAVRILAGQHRTGTGDCGRWSELSEFDGAELAVLVYIKLGELGAVAGLGFGKSCLLLMLFDFGTRELTIFVGVDSTELAVHLGKELGARDGLGSLPEGRGWNDE